VSRRRDILCQSLFSPGTIRDGGIKGLRAKEHGGSARTFNDTAFQVTVPWRPVQSDYGGLNDWLNTMSRRPAGGSDGLTGPGLLRTAATGDKQLEPLLPNVLMEAKKELDPGEREATPVILGLTECVALKVFLGSEFFLMGPN
jgi:hypothetical protein